MNEKIDLTKILKDCPKGWKLWSPLFGEVEFERNYEKEGFFNVSLVEDGTEWSFTSDARTFMGNIKSPEIMIYPNREARDWSKFTAPWYKKDKFDPKTLNPFDRVLCKNGLDMWRCDLFSSYVGTYACPNVCLGGSYTYCIPYNDDTKHLVGATDEAPEYYKYWED